MAYLLGVDDGTGNLYVTDTDKKLIAATYNGGLNWTVLSLPDFSQVANLSTFMNPAVVPYVSCNDAIFNNGSLNAFFWKGSFNDTIKCCWQNFSIYRLRFTRFKTINIKSLKIESNK